MVGIPSLWYSKKNTGMENPLDVSWYLAPVKMVLREGYMERDGYLWSDLPYTKGIGLQVSEGDIEF